MLEGLLQREDGGDRARDHPGKRGAGRCLDADAVQLGATPGLVAIQARLQDEKLHIWMTKTCVHTCESGRCPQNHAGRVVGARQDQGTSRQDSALKNSVCSRPTGVEAFTKAAEAVRASECWGANQLTRVRHPLARSQVHGTCSSSGQDLRRDRPSSSLDLV